MIQGQLMEQKSGNNQQVRSQRGWPAAYARFLASRSERITTKLLPLALTGIVPLSILDDALLPGIGLIDDIPTALLAAIIAAVTWRRVREYR